MRTFIAIDIGKTVTANISRLQDDIRRSLPPKLRGIKWVNPDLIHLTLKFLGEVGDDQIVDVCKAAARTAAEFSVFSINVEKVGSFGRPPRVIWIGTEESDTLCHLQQALDNRLTEIGFDPDQKRFIPHLTLCRVKNTASGRHLGRIISGFNDFSAGKIDVKSVCVYKSELTKTGPQYTLLARNDLV